MHWRYNVFDRKQFIRRLLGALLLLLATLTLLAVAATAQVATADQAEANAFFAKLAGAFGVSVPAMGAVAASAAFLVPRMVELSKHEVNGFSLYYWLHPGARFLLPMFIGAVLAPLYQLFGALDASWSVWQVVLAGFFVLGGGAQLVYVWFKDTGLDFLVVGIGSQPKPTVKEANRLQTKADVVAGAVLSAPKT